MSLFSVLSFLSDHLISFFLSNNMVIGQYFGALHFICGLRFSSSYLPYPSFYLINIYAIDSITRGSRNLVRGET